MPRATAAEWAVNTTVFGAGWIGKESDTGLEKEFDGVKYWSQLPYRNERPGLGPGHYGASQWNFPPTILFGGFDLSVFMRGYLIGMVLPCPRARKIYGLGINLKAGGAALTAGQNWLSLYQNGTYLGKTTDRSTQWGTAGFVAGNQGADINGGPIDVAAGDVVVGIVTNSTTNSAGQAPNVGVAIGGTGGGETTYQAGFKPCFYAGAGAYTTTPPATIPSTTALKEQIHAYYY